MRITRGLGVPALFAIGASTLGGSIYFGLGIVAGDALGLTPTVFLVAGAFFVLTMLTYLEGNSLHPERGGASTFARYAFNELWSFVAGWAILLDYMIVMAIGAFAISHYLSAFWSATAGSAGELVVAALALALVAWLNVRGVSADRLRFALRLGLVNLVLSTLVLALGLAEFFRWGAILGSVELGVTPGWTDLLVALTVASVALTGIEAASGLASDLRVSPSALVRVTLTVIGCVLVVLVGLSIVALEAVPVRDGSTELGDRFVAAPLLGVVAAYQPDWLAQALRYAVGGVAALVLFQVVNVNMLGVARLTYSLATNRQIPRALGRLDPKTATPRGAIVLASLVAFALVATADFRFLAGLFAFGAMLAFATAHASVIVLRFREPERPRAFRIPLSIRVGAGSVPLPAVVGLVGALGAFASVLVLQRGALVVGTGWMLFGVVLYVVYRRGQDYSLFARHAVPAQALSEAPDIEFASILVPVFGGPLDDDIVGTAGRLAAEEGEPGEAVSIEAIYVHSIPMSLPLDARLPADRVEAARRALARAKEVGEEYEGVSVATSMTRARTPGEAIVREARRRGVEAIVLAAEEPTRIRGGAGLGGRSARRERFVGEMTKYVLEKAPCRVILTAPPPSEERPRVRAGEGAGGMDGAGAVAADGVGPADRR